MLNDYRARVLADALDDDAWHAARSTRIGASDAAAFAKRESVELYVRAKCRNREFRGNAYTATGNRWEAPALSAYGFARNTLLIADALEDGFCATPDGIRETSGGLVLAEAKAVLIKDLERFNPDEWMPKIPPAHARQMSWAQMVLGAELTEYIVLPYDERHTPLLMVPRRIYVPRDDDAIARLRVIGTDVLAAMRAAAEFERNSHVLD